jgi:hypothetical protein
MMAKSKKSSKTSSVQPKSRLVQTRIPEEEHELLASMCELFDNSLAQRLGIVIHHELEEGYPMAFVEFGGVSHRTWMLIEKYEVPIMNDCFVLVAPKHAEGIFPEALDNKVRSDTRVTMPRRSPGIFALTSNHYQDARGIWHLQLLRIGQVPA